MSVYSDLAPPSEAIKKPAWWCATYHLSPFPSGFLARTKMFVATGPNVQNISMY